MDTTAGSNAMFRRLGRFLLIPAVLLLFAGCARHHPHHGAPPPNARVVVIQKGHVHSAKCGHYRHGKNWYHAKGHVHGPRCGHHKANGVWIIR
jgi:hypothetical protein